MCHNCIITLNVVIYFVFIFVLKSCDADKIKVLCIYSLRMQVDKGDYYVLNYEDDYYSLMKVTYTSYFGD